MSTTTVEELMTPGDIAAELGDRVQRVRYILTSRDIRPLRRVGIIRCYGRPVVEQVRSELEAIDQRRATVPAA